jgi:putative salt-induced outer membrane protein YdiY
MKTPRRTLGLAGAALTVILATGAPTQAAVIPGWYSTTDLIFSLQRGNSESLNLGVNANITRQWLRTAWRNQASFVRNDVNEPTRRAIGTNAGNAVLEKGPSVTKSEKVFINSTLERRVTERFFWNAGGSFERDIFAGLKSRYLGQAGIGYMWLKPDNSSRFQLGVAGTYTSQEDLVDDQDPETEDQFAGVRATADGEARFGDRKEHAYTSTLIVDENLQNTDDIRANWQNALSMALNQKLALKVSLQFAYDNLPQFVEFPLFTRLPNGSLAETQIKIPGAAEKLDTTLSVSLVINFAPGNQAGGGR